MTFGFSGCFVSRTLSFKTSLEMGSIDATLISTSGLASIELATDGSSLVAIGGVDESGAKVVNSFLTREKVVG